MLNGTLGRATVGIITITESEFENARRILRLENNVPGSAYFVESVKPQHAYEKVLARAIDRSNIPAFEVAGDLISEWRPAFIFLVGTAGAIWDEREKRGRDVDLGDVVVGDFVEYVEFTKLNAGVYIRRTIPLDHPSLCLRADFAEAARLGNDWRDWIGVQRPELPRQQSQGPRVMVGNIASGEKVLGDPTNDFQRYVMKNYDKAMAFEMESAGVARAVLRSRRRPDYNPQYLTIRGISDFINGKLNDKRRRQWTPYASSAAIAFSRSVIDRVLAHPWV